MASLPFLDPIIKTLDGTLYERLDPITDFRQCHGVVPPERRIIYRCRRLSSSASSPSPGSPCNDKNDYIMKIKVQIPDGLDDEAGLELSTATNHELTALQIFQTAATNRAPRLVAFETLQQGSDGLLPGGYISCTIMTTLPGQSLFDLGYWSLEPEHRVKIQDRFLEALAAVRKLGVEPGDKGLRNVMCDRETGKCGLVDFEMWQPVSGELGDSAEERTEELQKWGLAHRPPAKNWWAEFGIKTC